MTKNWTILLKSRVILMKINKYKDTTQIRKVKRVIIEMFRGYPSYIYWGFFEREFPKISEAETVIQLLKFDGMLDIIKSNKTNERPYYRLTDKGINFAISMIQLDYNDKFYEYNKNLSLLTNILTWLTGGLFILGLIQIIIFFF